MTPDFGDDVDGAITFWTSSQPEGAAIHALAQWGVPA